MGKILLLFFGVVALVMAGVSGWIGFSSRRQAAAADALAPLDAAAIDAAELGTAGYVEGRIAARNPELFRDFVLYYRSVLHGFHVDRDAGVTGNRIERRPIWKSVAKELPPLWLEVAGDEVRIFGDYAVTFQGRDPTWISTEKLEPGETERWEGLPRGHPVTAIGRVDENVDAEGHAGRGLRVETLASGTFDDYRSGEQSAALFGLVAAAILGLAGLILVAIGASL